MERGQELYSRALTQLHWGMSSVRGRGLRTGSDDVTTFEPQGTSRLSKVNQSHFRTFSFSKPPEMQAFPGHIVFKLCLALSSKLTSSLALKGCY